MFLFVSLSILNQFIQSWAWSNAGSNWFFIGPRNFQIEMDQRPDHGCGPKQSTFFPVHFSLEPVQSRFFGGPRTELPNTNLTHQTYGRTNLIPAMTACKLLLGLCMAQLCLKALALAWLEAALSLSNLRPGQSHCSQLGSGLAWPRLQLLYVNNNNNIIFCIYYIFMTTDLIVMPYIYPYHHLCSPGLVICRSWDKYDT